MYVLKGQGLFGGPDQWLESGPHHTLVLGPGDHVEIKNEVLIVLCYVHCFSAVTTLTGTLIFSQTNSYILFSYLESL